jgi:flotillin
MSFDVAPSYTLYTNQGIPVTVEAISQLKVENEDEKIKRAANQFLSKSEADREMMVRQVMEGRLRGIVGQLTVEQLVKDPELVSARMRETVAADLDKLGLEVISFTLKDVTDGSGFIQNMNRPEIARNKQVAEIAEAARNVTIRQADTQRESAQARAKADQDRVLAQTLSQAAQAESQRDLEVKEAEYAAVVAAQKAQADRAYDIQSNITQQRQVEEQTKVQIIQKQQEIKVQQAEGDRRAAELLATVQRQADAERERIRILAEAERQRAVIEAEGRANAMRMQIETEAEGRANAMRMQIETEAEGRAKAVRVQAEADAAAILARGQADAEALRLKGMAEAEAIKAKGMAEAEARQRAVEALNMQNGAAITDTALAVLPQVAQHLFEAYGRVGNVTYVGTGGGENGGVTSRVTQEVAGMIPLLGAVFESTTGLKLRDIITQGQQSQNTGASSEANGRADHAASSESDSRRDGAVPVGATHATPVVEGALVPMAVTTPDGGAPNGASA